MSTSIVILLSAIALVLTALVAVCCGSLVEVFAQLDQLRTQLSLDDKPIPLAVGEDHQVTPREIGLPEAIRHSPETIAVFLSGKCATCWSIAEAFKGGAPDPVWFVVIGTETDGAALTAVLAGSSSRVIVDTDGLIVNRTGIKITPAVLTFKYGELEKAHAVSSAKQVLSLIPTSLPLSTRSYAAKLAEAAATSTRPEFADETSTIQERAL